MPFELRDDYPTLAELDALQAQLDPTQAGVIDDWHRFGDGPRVAAMSVYDEGTLVGAGVLAKPSAEHAPLHAHVVALPRSERSAMIVAVADHLAAATETSKDIELWLTAPLLGDFTSDHWQGGRRIEKLRLADGGRLPAPLATEPLRARTDAVVRINNAAFVDHADRSSFTNETVRHQIDAHRGRDEDIRLVVRDDVARAFVWTTYEDQVGEIHVLAVHPEWQGQHWGAPLLAAGVEHLQQTYAPREIVLYVDADNERARSMYLRHGFANANEPRQAFTRRVGAPRHR